MNEFAPTQLSDDALDQVNGGTTQQQNLQDAFNKMQEAKENTTSPAPTSTRMRLKLSRKASSLNSRRKRVVSQ